MNFDINVLRLIKKGLIGIIVIMIMIFVLILIGYFVQKNAPLLEGGDQLNVFAVTGSIGDTINGIFASLIGSFAVLTTFLAFIVQYEANKKIVEQFKHERFENKFYESLRVHKENVQEIQIDNNHQGRKAFVWMYKEYRFIYQLTKSIYDDLSSNEELRDKLNEIIKYDERHLAKLAYIIFFFGVGEVSNKGIEYYISEYNEKLNNRIIEKLIRCKRVYSEQSKRQRWVSIKSGVYNDSVNEIHVDFEPFDGHVSKLGHYFRHLYQLIKLATTDPILNRENEDEEKKLRYEYVKQIRVQLSNHEQAMIYYNSFFDAGKVWWGDKTIDKKTDFDGRKYDLSYFLDYKMIKNIPYNLTDGIGPDPKHEFFLKFLERGYSLDTTKEQDKLKEKLQNDFFEWGFKDEFFSKYVQEHPNSKVQ